MNWDFIYFTKVERGGLISLLISIIVISIGQYYWNLNNINHIDTEAMESHIIQLLKEELDKNTIAIQVNEATPILTKKSIPIITNPNQANLEDLIALGISKYAANNLLKYRKKGGQINSLSDMSKIYGVDSTTLLRISSYLQFDKVKEKSKLKKHQSKNIKLKNDSTFNSKSYIESNIATSSTIALNNIDIKDLPPFDPNTAPLETLLNYGISNKISNTIINFRNKGGGFDSKDDLLKIYGFTTSLLDSLSSKITIIPISVTPQTKIPEEVISMLDLNTADANELIKIKGIGPYLSKAIITYRTALGGFYHVNQLKEVPYLKPETYDSIEALFVVKGNIKKFIPIGMTFKEVLKHPYTDYETTKLLFNLSASNYNKDLESLIKKGVIDKRLTPYLTVE